MPNKKYKGPETENQAQELYLSGNYSLEFSFQNFKQK